MPETCSSCRWLERCSPSFKMCSTCLTLYLEQTVTKLTIQTISAARAASCTRRLPYSKRSVSCTRRMRIHERNITDNLLAVNKYRGLLRWASRNQWTTQSQMRLVGIKLRKVVGTTAQSFAPPIAVD